MEEHEQLYNAAKWRAKRQPDGTVRLGDIVEDYIDNQVSPQQARFELITRQWDQMLPVELRRHCKIVDICGGQMEVLVDSPPHMHELRLCSPELLAEMQQRCPKARIKKIKLAVG